MGGLQLDLNQRAVLSAGGRMELTPREFDVLAALAEREGQVVSREELYVAVWNARYRRSERSVDVYVSRLRRKLAARVPGEQLIHTHFGVGYRLGGEETAS